ncbi:MAG: 1-acyl-sn-glycerol-3-phosphate acyltransferase [Bacteroidetes bacterium]|nr:1-acyl-sn-glycerol-3-phosphate acyltransferase [Bacteroidota bacterium]
MLQRIYAFYAILMFVLILLVVMPFALLLARFNKKQKGLAVMRLAHIWSDVWLWLIGIRHQRIVEAELEKGKSYIFVSNHNSYMDIPQLLQAVRSPLKGLGKAEVGDIPLFGIIYKAGVVTVNRSCAEARARSVAELKELLHDGISIYIAPEGTFNESNVPLSKFYDGAFRLAIQTQTPIKPLLFLDAVDRMHWSSLLTINPGKLRTVYLDAISPAGYTEADLPVLRQKVYDVMEAKLREYKASWIR